MHYNMTAFIKSALERDNYRRYGTWDLLHKPRTFTLIHRLWSGGSQRALLWSDPEWIGRFAATCAPTGAGFEIMAPLSHKGVRDQQSAWAVATDPAFRSNGDEHGRHWLFYLLFGRLGYAPDAGDDPVIEAAAAQVIKRRLTLGHTERAGIEGGGGLHDAVQGLLVARPFAFLGRVDGHLHAGLGGQALDRLGE